MGKLAVIKNIQTGEITFFHLSSLSKPLLLNDANKQVIGYLHLQDFNMIMISATNVTANEPWTIVSGTSANMTLDK